MIARKFKNRFELTAYCFIESAKRYDGGKYKKTGLVAFIPHDLFPDTLYFYLADKGIRTIWTTGEYGVGYDSRRT